MEPNSDPFSKLMETPPFFESWYTWIAIFLVAVLAGFRSYLKGPQYFSQTPLDGKVALITGGNRGIGFHTAKELATRGAKVYLACRDSELANAAVDKLKQLTGSTTIYYLPLALGSLENVRTFCANFKKKEEKLDILCCNAGVMTCPLTKTTDGLEYHLGVNYVAHYVLVNELLPLLRAAAPSRIVLITSAAYKLGTIHFEDINQEKVDYGNGADCFSQSKLALMQMMNKLHRMLQGSEVTVNACHPGVVRTDIHRYMPISTSKFLHVSTFPICWYLMKGAPDGAQTPIYMCIDTAVKDVSGKYYVDMQENALEPNAADDEAADKLWTFTQQLIDDADKRRLEGGAGDQPEDGKESGDGAQPADKEAEEVDDGDKKTK